jgi:hypothetical protein
MVAALVSEGHCGARGMFSVTLVPFPGADSSSTLPPWASTNWRRQRQTEAKRRLPACLAADAVESG